MNDTPTDVQVREDVQDKNPPTNEEIMSRLVRVETRLVMLMGHLGMEVPAPRSSNRN